MTSRLDIDQSSGDLTVHTGRAGLGSRVGHDLTLRVGRWTAEATLDDRGAVSRLRLVAALDSLEVVRGEGGLKPLSEKDEETILSNAAETLRTRLHPQLVFDAGDLHVTEGTNRVTGQLSLGGSTKPQTVEIAVARRAAGASVQAHARLLQSEFGIKPYSGMLGALKVRDAAEVRADLTVNLPWERARSPGARRRRPRA